jgi:hypothetical protein
MRPTPNERTLSRAFFVLIAILALASSSPPPALGQLRAPDVFMRLDDRLLRARRVRITTPSGGVVAEGVRVSVEGLAYRNLLGTTGVDTLPIPGRIPWDAVVRVDVPSNHALAAGLGTGVILAGIAGAGVYSAGQQGTDIGGGGILLLAVPVVAALAAGVGALMPSWHPIYRNRHAPADRR